MPFSPGGLVGPPGPPGPPTIVRDEGVPLAGAPHTTLNFVGAGVAATDAGGGVALITIPAGGGGAPADAEYIVAALNATLTAERLATDTAEILWIFTAPGVATLLVGAIAQAKITGLVAALAARQLDIQIQDEGVNSGAPGDAITYNFVGAGVSAAVAAGVATITIPAAAATANDVAQATRSTAYVTTAVFTDIDLQTTDVETDAAVIDHLAGTPDRITILVTGTYEIGYEIDCDTQTVGAQNHTFEAQVRVNDATVLVPGSARNNVFRDSAIEGNEFNMHLSMKFVRNFVAADFVTLQLRALALGTSTIFPITRANGITMTVVRLK